MPLITYHRRLVEFLSLSVTVKRLRTKLGPTLIVEFCTGITGVTLALPPNIMWCLHRQVNIRYLSLPQEIEMKRGEIFYWNGVAEQLKACVV